MLSQYGGEIMFSLRNLIAWFSDGVKGQGLSLQIVYVIVKSTGLRALHSDSGNVRKARFLNDSLSIQLFGCPSNGDMYLHEIATYSK